MGCGERATSYNIYRFYAKIATVSKNSYTSNPNLKPDTAYIFNVSAVNSVGNRNVRPILRYEQKRNHRVRASGLFLTYKNNRRFYKWLT